MASLIKRGKIYHLQYYVGRKIKRRSLSTTSYQIAREKLRQFESAQFQGQENLLPTRTPLADILARYVNHIRTVKTAKSAQTDVYYLRQMFGPICQPLEITSRKVGPNAMKRPPKGTKKRSMAVIESTYIEHITTAQISEFISAMVRARGLAPKTANRFREILTRLFNWSMAEGGVKLPADMNPAAKVGRYKQHASTIRFLTLDQITEQVDALQDYPQLQVMVALFIYAGLRREEALWLTVEDIDLRSSSNGMIRIRAKEIDGQYWEPKTKINRGVPISSTLRQYITRYTPRPSIGGLYFPSPKGQHYDPDNFSRDLRNAQKASGLKWTCLDFRHTFGSQLAMKGESLYKISKLMGNSPDICRTHYAALISEELSDSVEFHQVETPYRVRA